MRDTFTAGTVAGLIGTLVILALQQALFALDIIQMTTMDVAAEIFLEPHQTGSIAGILVGLISHFLVGAGGGVLLAYFIRFTGKDYYWLKGLGLGAFMLLVGMALVTTIMNIMPEMREDSLTTLLHMLTYFIYGLTCSYVLTRYGKFEFA